MNVWRREVDRRGCGRQSCMNAILRMAMATCGATERSPASRRTRLREAHDRKRSACPCPTAHLPPWTTSYNADSVRRDSSSRCAGDGLGAKRRTGSGKRVQRGTSAWRPSAIASSRASDGVLAGRGNAPERRGSGAHSGPSTVCNPLRQAKWGGQSLARAGCLGSLPCHAAGRVRRTARRRPYRASGRVPYRGRRVRFDQRQASNRKPVVAMRAERPGDHWPSSGAASLD